MMIEFDVETTSLQWYSGELFLVQFLMPDEENARLFDHPHDRNLIQQHLNQNDGYRAWNAKFDLHFLKAAGYELPPEERWHDGMVMAHLLDERRSVALQSVANSMFGEDEAAADTEAAVKDWLTAETKRRREASKASGEEFVRPNYSDVPDEIMHPYAAHDVVLTRRVCQALEPMMSDELWELYDLEMRVMRALFATESHGIHMDVAGLRKLEAEVEGTLDRLTCEAATLAGSEDFNPKSSVQIGQALQARGADLTFARKLKSGLPSTDNESLEQVDDKLARTILDFRSAEKMFSTYVHPMLHWTLNKKINQMRAPFVNYEPGRRTGWLYPNFRQMGTRTGRMSSSDPNVQNWPRDDLRLRHCAVAQPGFKLVAADLDSIELVLFAAFVGPGTLKDYVLDPEKDMHTYTAKMIGLEDFDRGEGHIESARQRGKKFNYLVLYGGGTRAIRRWFHVDQKTAKQYERRYHETYPEVQEFQEDIECKLYDKGYIKSPWGRLHRPYDARNADREAYKFVNYIVQGTAADLIKAATARVHEEYRLSIVAIVHDEIVVEVPEEEALEASDALVTCLTDHPRITKHVPIGADAKIVDRWSHAKDADFVPPYEQENTDED